MGRVVVADPVYDARLPQRYSLVYPKGFVRIENQLKDCNLQLYRAQRSYGVVFHVKHDTARLADTSHRAPRGGGGLLELGPVMRSSPTVFHKVIHSDIHRTMHRHLPARGVIDTRWDVV